MLWQRYPTSRPEYNQNLTLLQRRVPAGECFFTVVSKQEINNNNKNEKMKHHGTFTPFKNQLYSKPGSPIFLLLGSWSLVFIFMFG